MSDWLLRLDPSKSRRIRPLAKLPGDTPDLVDALTALGAAGLLPNVMSEHSHRQRCPRCGRPTAAQRSDVWQPVSVCTGCRAGWISEHPDWVARHRRNEHPGTAGDVVIPVSGIAQSGCAGDSRDAYEQSGQNVILLYEGRA